MTFIPHPEALSEPLPALAPLQLDVDDLRDLGKWAELRLPRAASTLDEATLDAWALELRQQWLQRGHRPADGILKSPREGTAVRIPGGGRISYGYERELDAGVLEGRAPLDYRAPSGWSSSRVLFRSGQAALACLLHLVSRLHDGDGPLSVHHAGKYFETASLLRLWPRRSLSFVEEGATAADLVIGEPVHCDGRFGLSDVAVIPRARLALLLDVTLCALEVDLDPWLASLTGPLAVVFRSGLKLDQAGLELANVGIVQLFVRDEHPDASLDDMAERLRDIRTLTGAGLTLDEMAALSAPWVLDPDYLRYYSGHVFRHNAALAHAIGNNSILFEDFCHPSLLDIGTSRAVAPFCSLRLRDGDVDAHRRLLEKVAEEVTRRNLCVGRGGSFGFRESRYELIEPSPGQGFPFLRVAMGFRGGPSTAGLIELLRELSCHALE